jgi:hypothetical protein
MNLVSCRLLRRSLEKGTWYRAIQPPYWPKALFTRHTLTTPSRFNEGVKATPQFELLYLTENAQVALFEVEALYGSPTNVTATARPYATLNIDVQLHEVVDLTDVSEQSQIETNAQELTGDWRGYDLRSNSGASIRHPVGCAPTQELGAALFAEPRLEGFITISAKVPSHRNLVVFPQKLLPRSYVKFYDTSTGRTYKIP